MYVNNGTERTIKNRHFTYYSSEELKEKNITLYNKSIYCKHSINFPTVTKRMFMKYLFALVRSDLN